MVIFFIMSNKTTDTFKSIEHEGVSISSYYGRYVANSYDQAYEMAKSMNFLGGIRIDGVEKSDMFTSENEFEELIRKVKYPVAIVPIL